MLLAQVLWQLVLPILLCLRIYLPRRLHLAGNSVVK
jgi:hypothetical protein